MHPSLEHWKSKSTQMPDAHTSLDYHRVFSQREFEQLEAGLIPEEMEDKWFCHLQEDTLYIHRSWSGYCIYEVKLEKSKEGFKVSEALANRNPEQYTQTDNSFDVWMLDSLITNHLLR
jgi:hypothetical protein